MNRVDFDADKSRENIARAIGIPAAFLSRETAVGDGVIEAPAHTHRADCYGTLEHSEELLCGYSSLEDATPIPSLYCCEECAYYETQQTQRPSTNGGCS
jgi:hypothetical protein